MELIDLASDLQRLMYAESQNGQFTWNPAKQTNVSPADLKQDLELLMRKFKLLSELAPIPTEIRVTLARTGSADLEAVVSAQHGTLEISFPGYSDKTSDFGPVIYLELDQEGHPMLYAWTDITNEEPTHVLSFAKAVDERSVE